MSGRDPGPGLADLLAVRPPAGAGHDPRHADRPVEQPGQLLELAERLGAAHAAAAADDDPGVGQRDLAGLGRDPGRRPGPAGPRRISVGANVSTLTAPGDGASSGGVACSAIVTKRTGPSSRASSSRLPPQRWRVTSNGVAGPQLDAVGGHRRAGHRGGVGQDLLAAIVAGRQDDRRRRDRRDQLGDGPAPGGRRVAVESGVGSTTQAGLTPNAPSAAAAAAAPGPNRTAPSGSPSAARRSAGRR